MSDPGLRLSVSELEEIKPLASLPPRTPAEAAEKVDLDAAMEHALSAKQPAPAPTIRVSAPPEQASDPGAAAMPRWVQASIALVLGAGIAFAVQSAASNQESQSVARRGIAPPTGATAPDLSDEPEHLPEPATTTLLASTEPSETADRALTTAAQRGTDTADTAGTAGTEGSIFDAPETASTQGATPAATTSHRPAGDPTERPRREAASGSTGSGEAAADRARERRQQGAAAAGEARAARAAAATEAATADLPEHPSRAEVQSAMQAINGYIEACANGAHGQANMDITIHPSGRVQRAHTGGTFTGTPEGSCMAREARRARFPRFSGESFSINFPYRF